MEILIRQYQLWAGFSQSVLLDTTPCPWIPDRWLSQIHWTMHEHNIKIHHETWHILPLQQHDVFLMEAISNSNLSQSQLEQVNACCMFLQVTMLAEMVDHTGMLILLQVLKLPCCDMPKGLTQLSSLRLQWPHISPPSTASWRLWTRTICNIFTGTPNGTKLQHPLGAWTSAYQEIQEWKWRLSNHGSLLHQQQPNATPCVAMLTTTQCTKLTFTLTVPTNQSFEGPQLCPMTATTAR